MIYKKTLDGKIQLPCVFKNSKAHVLNSKDKVELISSKDLGYSIVNIANVDITGPATVIKIEGEMFLNNK